MPRQVPLTLRKSTVISAFLRRPVHTRAEKPHRKISGKCGGVVRNAAVQDHSQTAQLSRLEEELRLRLAAKGAGAAAFDWDVAGGTIAWDGALSSVSQAGGG